MFKRTKVSMAVAVALGAFAVPAMAQDSTQRIEITGSHIKSLSTDTASPIVSVTAESIKIDAPVNVEDLTNNLPQVFAGFGAQVSNGATGTATLDLRGLGPERTLVLVNGRRLPAGDPNNVGAPYNAVPDLNQIPVSLIKRVDVLTGGASAVYGSDAIAGVVNFVMNDRFQGVQVEVNRSIYNHSQHNPSGVDAANNAKGFALPGNVGGDGGTTSVSLTMGSNFAGDKGNATVFFGYLRQAAMLQAARDFSACTLSPTKNGTFSCGGSGTAYPTNFTLDFNTYTTLDAQGNAIPGPSLYNYGPLNYFQRPDERYTAAAYTHYDISDLARVYSEFNFMDDRSVAQIAPSGTFFTVANISGLNPLVQPDMQAALGITPGSAATVPVYIGRRNVEGGGRQDDLHHTSFRAVAGVKGDVGPWSYDVSAQIGKVIYQEEYKNDFSFAKLTRALNVVADPATGQAVCQSVVDGTDPNCVPYNVWAPNGVTSSALNYVSAPGFKNGSTSQLIYSANGSVDLGAFGVKLPGTSEGASLAFGLENRQEKLELNTDQEFSSGDLAGQGGPTIGVAGGYSVRDIYGEFRLPLLEHKPGAERLTLDTSYRNSSYSTDKKTNTYGMGLDWTVVKGYQVRGSIQRAARAPNVIDLYSAQSVGLFNMSTDPCSGPVDSSGKTAAGYTLAQCQNTGVTAAQFGNIGDSPAGQFNALYGGNPNLKAETSNSYTFGVVLQPIRDLSLTADFFSFKVQDAISTADPTIALTQCLTTGNPALCGLIHRATGSGTLWTGNSYVTATNANLATLKTSGIDLGADYSMKLGGMGRLDYSFLGTALRNYETEPLPGIGTYDCAGYFGSTCGSPNPKWRHKLRVTWISPYNMTVSATWRYFGSVKDQGTSTNPLLNTTNISLGGGFAAQNYLDLSASYNVTKNLTARLGVQNVLDKDPPLAKTGSPFGNGNTYPVSYDSMGRKISLNLTASF
jgi:iron complex outermembrane recepter protein